MCWIGAGFGCLGLDRVLWADSQNCNVVDLFFGETSDGFVLECR